jgi:predicted dehydrogenase
MKLNYGIIGTGMMGCEHIRNLKKIPNVDIVAIADPNMRSREWAKQTCGETFDPVLYASYEELLSKDNIDVVVVASPNHTHIDVMRKIFETDKHVLLEKPMCTNLSDGLEVLEMSKKHQGIVWIGLEYRFMAPIQSLINHVEEIGDIKMLSIREHRFPFLQKVENWNRFNKNTGGTLVEKCCHFFDLMNLIMPSKPIKVYASGGQSVNHLDEQYDGKIPDIIDNSFVLIDYEDGQRAMLDLCMFAEGGKYEQEIILTGDRGKLETHIPGNELLLTNRKLNSHSTIEIKEDARVKEVGFHHGASYVEHLELIECIKTGNQPLVNCLDGLNSIILGMAAQESIKTGEAVNLKAFLKN